MCLVRGVCLPGENGKFILVFFELRKYIASCMTRRIVLLVYGIILRINKVHIRMDMVRKDRWLLLLMYCFFHNERMPWKHSQSIMLPPPGWTVKAMTKGCLLMEVLRPTRQRPSVPRSTERDSSENATCCHSVDVQLRYSRDNSNPHHRWTAVIIGAWTRNLLRRLRSSSVRGTIALETLLVVHWLIWAVSSSTIEHLFARTHLHIL